MAKAKMAKAKTLKSVCPRHGMAYLYGQPILEDEEDAIAFKSALRTVTPLLHAKQVDGALAQLFKAVTAAKQVLLEDYQVGDEPTYSLGQLIRFARESASAMPDWVLCVPTPVVGKVMSKLEAARLLAIQRNNTHDIRHNGKTVKAIDDFIGQMRDELPEILALKKLKELGH